MKLSLRLLIVAVSLTAALFAQTPITAPKQLAAPMVPMPIALPSGHHPFFRVHAKGVQIYSCSDAKGAPAWSLVGPDAQLYDENSRLIGTHYAVKGSGAGSSPAWKLVDGSEIVGEKVAAADAPDGKGVPWLLLKVVSNQKHGILAEVIDVQRVHTAGGKPPDTSCSTVGAQTRSDYTADYYFAK
jgi:hypothetical protein